MKPPRWRSQRPPAPGTPARRKLRRRLGPAAGTAAFNDISFQNSALAPTTTSSRFPYPEPNRVAVAAGTLPDPDSVQPIVPITAVGGMAGDGAGRTVSRSLPPDAWWAGLLGASRLGRGGGESYAVLVGGGHSASGRPIADMGPQLDFFSPEIVMEETLQAPGISISGAALPGAAPVPVLGHTDSFARSITIGVGQHVSIFALKLCNADGSTPSRSSTSYLYMGRCLPMLQRTQTETTKTSIDNSAPPQTFVLRTLRSIYGPVVATGTVHGMPVAFARADTTYGHLADTAVPLLEMTDGAVNSPQSFVSVARSAAFSLNWFYIDARNIAWTLSGRYPLPPARVVVAKTGHRGRRTLVTEGPSPTAPIWGTGVWNWPGFTSDATSPSGLTTYTSRLVPGPRIPHVINRRSGVIANWNNKPAPGWRASDDDYYYGPVYRVTMYRQRLAAAIAAGHGRSTSRSSSRSSKTPTLSTCAARSCSRGSSVLPARATRPRPAS